MLEATTARAAAQPSWFTTSHIALIVSIAALAVTAVGSVITIYYARRNTRAAEASAALAEASAKASGDSAASARISAKAARDIADIEQDREYDRVRPRLRGRLVPAPGPDPINAWLEIHLDAATPQPLRTLLLTVPAGAWFARGRMGDTPSLGANDFGFPEESWQRPPICPGQPARWRVCRSDRAHGTLSATARCTREDGVVWEDVEVLITQDLDGD